MVKKIKATRQQWVDILAQKELPTITAAVTMLDQYSDDTLSIANLSQAILDDHDLSSCVLKVANNSQRISVSKITTPSHAAIVIGIPAVKNICITAKIMQVLLDNKSLAPEVNHRLAMLMATAFYAGLLAKIMVPDHNDEMQEQVYLAAMLYHIGEISFWRAPSEEANALIKDVHLPAKKFQQKCQSQLGLKFTDLSVGLVKTWHLPDLLIKTLDEPESDTIETQAINFANQLSWAILNPPNNKIEFDNILKRICVMMNIELRFLKQRIEQTRELAIELLAYYGASILEHYIKELPKSDDFVQSISDPLIPRVNTDKALLTTLKQLTTMCRSSKNINDFLTFTLQQSVLILKFERSVFWLLTSDRKQIEVRSSYDGAGYVEHLQHTIEVGNKANLIRHIIEMGDPIVINDIQDKKWQSYLTPELEIFIGGGAICLLPVKIDDKIVGIISGQRFDKTEKIRIDDFSQFSFLIEHLNMCLSNISHR